MNTVLSGIFAGLYFRKFHEWLQICKIYLQIFLSCWKMVVVTVYVSDTSEMIHPGYQACILLYKFGHPIIFSKYVQALSKSAYMGARVRCPTI